MSTVASIQRLPRAAHTGRVTQFRVILSEWTKLHSLRSTRWSLLAGIFFVLPPLMNVLPLSWNNAISQYLPSEAGRQIFSLTHGAHSLAPWPGGLLFLGYCALTLAIAAVSLTRRDT